MNEFLLDTDVAVDFLRGYIKAIDFVNKHSKNCSLSTITVSELYAGVKEGKERQDLVDFISLFQVLNITHEIAELGGLFKRDFGRTHGVGLADALIAATSKIHQVELKTSNIKHYPMLKNVIAPYSR